MSYKHLKKNENEWLPLLNECATKGSANAQGCLVEYYLEKNCVTDNMMHSFKLFAKNGSVNAQYWLGKFYIAGKYGLDVDVKKGTDFLEQAAKKGCKRSQRFLDERVMQVEALSSRKRTNANILSWFSGSTKK